jgi:aspartate carbamoyltransferase catalytic subunit
MDALTNIGDSANETGGSASIAVNGIEDGALANAEARAADRRSGADRRAGEARVGERCVGESRVGESRVGESRVGENPIGESRIGDAREGVGGVGSSANSGGLVSGVNSGGVGSSVNSGGGGGQARVAFRWNRKHLLTLESFSPEELIYVLDTADSFKEVSTRSVKKVPALRGRVVVNAFWEDSTRTRTSFSLAASRLSADVIDFTERGSSVSKGETLIDTARNLEAMGIDAIVIRHPAAGAAELVSRMIRPSVINAGDGAHEHPTQGLLDLYTIREKFGKIAGLKVAIVGDIVNSRVARSNIWGLTKLGAEVILVGPPTLLPRGFEHLGAKVVHDFDSVIGEVDVINMLRVQFERIKSSQFPSVREFTKLFGLTPERFERCKKDVFVMHPGPMNRGIEISSHIADGPSSGILTQVTNGLAVRMAVLYLVTHAGA